MDSSNEIHSQPTILGPSYFELFAIHLAEHLNGSALLIQKLEDNPSSDIFYWRTRLLVGLNHLEEVASADLFTCVMLDVTIRLLRRESTDQPFVTLEFGAILMQSNSLPQLYIKGEPFSITDLYQHVEVMGIDIDSTAPKAMAISMGNALCGIITLTRLQVTFENSSKVATALFPIIYSDLEETGTLLIKAKTTSTLDTSTSFMLLQNFAQQDRTRECNENFARQGRKMECNENFTQQVRTRESNETQCSDLLIAALATWWTPALNRSPADMARKTTTTSSVKKHQLIPRGNVARYTRFPMKRKQLGALSYAQEDDS